MTKGLIASRKTKEKLFNKSCKSPTFTNVEAFKTYNKLYCNTCRQAKNKFFKDKFKEVEGNMRATWATLREAMGTPRKCSKLPGYFKAGANKIRTDSDIAEGFNKFFSTIGSNLDKELRSSSKCYKDYLTSTNSSFNFRRVTIEEVIKIIQSMKPKKVLVLSFFPSSY